MSVLVTGAQGFIGSWLAKRLLDGGAHVVAPLRRWKDGSWFALEGLGHRCHLVAIDLGDVRSIERVLNEYDVELVFHLAAQTIVGEANRSPMTTFHVNARGTYNLLEACRVQGREALGPRVVIASSYHVYGAQDDGGYSEELGLRPSYPYDVSKACADMIARGYAATYGMPVAVTRLANVYGGGDLNFSRLVPDAARALAAGDRPVIRSDGTPERDYLYVEDAVDAYLAVAESLERPEHRGRAWNAGADSPLSVLEVVERLIVASGRDVKPEILGQRNPHDEISRQYLDSNAIRRELGWQPVRSLDEGLRATFAWYERHMSAGGAGS